MDWRTLLQPQFWEAVVELALVALMLTIVVLVLTGFSIHRESWYIEKVRLSLAGESEVNTTYGRADLTTGVYAIEVDYLDKFKEGIGQALWYGWTLKKRPGLVVIADYDDAKAAEILDTIRRHSVIHCWLIDRATGKVTEWNGR